MTPFHLKIVTPDGLIFDGQAEELIVRTTGGDVAILARHMDYVAPLGMGRATVVSGGVRRNAACIGGMLSVSGGEVTLVPTTFEWSDKIDGYVPVFLCAHEDISLSSPCVPYSPRHS